MSRYWFLSSRQEGRSAAHVAIQRISISRTRQSPALHLNPPAPIRTQRRAKSASLTSPRSCPLLAVCTVRSYMFVSAVPTDLVRFELDRTIHPPSPASLLSHLDVSAQSRSHFFCAAVFVQKKCVVQMRLRRGSVDAQRDDGAYLTSCTHPLLLLPYNSVIPACGTGQQALGMRDRGRGWGTSSRWPAMGEARRGDR
jgi:hypothetical protein